MNSEHIIPLFIVGTIMLLIGITLFFFPQKIRKYDIRITKLIRDEDQYILFVRVLGVIFIMTSVPTIILSFFLAYLARYS
jgi:uncharacterized membrane protein HdeD (DUF308 family)